MAFSGEDAESHYDEGLTASMMGDPAKAVEHFERAIRLDNTMSPAYHQLGKCYLRLGRAKEGVQLLEQVVKQRPQQIPPRLDLGAALLDLNRIAEARRQFEQVLALNPENGKAQLGMARVDFHEGNWAGAMAGAQVLVTGGGSGFALLYLLGRTAKLAGNDELSQTTLKKADALLEKYVEMDPEQPEGHFLRGEVSFAQGDFVAALDHYRRSEDHVEEGRGYVAYGESFTLLDVYAKGGLCCQRLGELERAREMGKRICDMDPEHKLGKALLEAK